MDTVLERPQSRLNHVTPWRQEIAGLAGKIVALIQEHEDPERRFQTARETGEDLVHAVRTELVARFGKVFDPLFDGPPA